LGNLDGTPFYVGHEQFEYWRHAQLIIDVANGAVETDSLDGGGKKRFLTRSRLFSEEENSLLEKTVLTGPRHAADFG
jgi:uncharacterized protein (DUF779 family)